MRLGPSWLTSRRILTSVGHHAIIVFARNQSTVFFGAPPPGAESVSDLLDSLSFCQVVFAYFSQGESPLKLRRGNRLIFRLPRSGIHCKRNALYSRYFPVPRSGIRCETSACFTGAHRGFPHTAPHIPGVIPWSRPLRLRGEGYYPPIGPPPL